MTSGFKIKKIRLFPLNILLNKYYNTSLILQSTLCLVSTRYSSHSFLGNHEIYPLDQYDFERNTTTWLQERLGSVWDVWLDDQALSSFREKTYYSMVNTQHNIKIIALNTQTCDSFNLYLLLDPTDPYYQVLILPYFCTKLFSS